MVSAGNQRAAGKLYDRADQMAVYGGIAFVAGVIVLIWANRKRKVVGP
jgi:hypothetical protein